LPEKIHKCKRLLNWHEAHDGTGRQVRQRSAFCWKWGLTLLNLNLMLLGDAKRFQEMCFRLARYEFPKAVPLAESWDGGRDIVVFSRNPEDGDVVFQCKFIEDLAVSKPKIRQSLDALLKNGRRTALWILCVPVNPSGLFMNWLNAELEDRGVSGFVWGKSELMLRLEQHRDVVENFFSSALAELSTWFHTERLDLFRLSLDENCAWEQPDPKVLLFGARNGMRDSDLILDVILRNKTTAAEALTKIQADVFDRRVKMHGIPGEGLLFPQITYTVSIRGGQSGTYFSDCEPPLVIKTKDLERFKIRVTDTGYAWNGGLRLSLHFGVNEHLSLPAIRLFT